MMSQLQHSPKVADVAGLQFPHTGIHVGRREVEAYNGRHRQAYRMLEQTARKSTTKVFGWLAMVAAHGCAPYRDDLSYAVAWMYRLFIWRHPACRLLLLLLLLQPNPIVQSPPVCCHCCCQCCSNPAVANTRTQHTARPGVLRWPAPTVNT
jgi:hypothetical protein